jgi:hypothetical protein
MTSSIRFVALVLLCLAFKAGAAVPFTFAPGSAEDEAAVSAQAKEVFRLIDAGQAGAAWDGASTALQQQTPKAAFIAALKSMREAMGELQDRTPKAIGFVTNMPDAPPGYYAGAFFESKFARGTVEEKAVFVRQDAKWQLVGYFMSKRFTVQPRAGELTSPPVPSQ